MTKNIMIVGVGGQGTLLASRILGNVVIGEGYDVKVSEVLLENVIPTDSNAVNQSISNPKIKFAELNYQSIRKNIK